MPGPPHGMVPLPAAALTLKSGDCKGHPQKSASGASFLTAGCQSGLQPSVLTGGHQSVNSDGCNPDDQPAVRNEAPDADFRGCPTQSLLFSVRTAAGRGTIPWGGGGRALRNHQSYIQQLIRDSRCQAAKRHCRGSLCTYNDCVNVEDDLDLLWHLLSIRGALDVH